MEEILRSQDIQMKLLKLRPESRKAFVDVIQKVYEDESRDMVSMLKQSRKEIYEMGSDIKAEQQSLREQLNELFDKQERKRGRENMSRMSVVSYSEGVGNTRANRQRRRKAHAAKDAGNGGKKTPSSARSTRSLPNAVLNMAIEEEKEMIFKNLDAADAKKERERKRQAAIVEQMKEQQRQKQQENASKARELIAQASNLDKVLDQCKISQQEKVKEKVEERKRKKGETAVQTISVEPLNMQFNKNASNSSSELHM